MKKQSFYLRRAISLVFFISCVCLTFLSCKDESLVDAESKTKSTDPFNTKIETSIISLSANAQTSTMPLTDATDASRAGTTRAVVLDEDFNPMKEGTDFKTRIFLVRVDNQAKIANGKSYKLDANKVALATAEINWTTTTEGADKNIKLYCKEDELKLSWLNGATTIKKGEKWYICGIIGGTYNNEWNNEKDQKKRLFYVDFDPQKNTNLGHNGIHYNGKCKAAVPFATNWQSIVITEDNKISVRNFIYKPLGVLLRFRIKRNTKILKPAGHQYTFTSSQISPSGGFFMAPKELLGEDKRADSLGVNNITLCPETPSIESHWRWDHEKDHCPWYDVRTKSEQKWKYDFKYRYTYDATNTGADGYDYFYVWGMPIKGHTLTFNMVNGKNTINAYREIEHRSSMTGEKGGFMLGKQTPNKKGYADEWLIGDEDEASVKHTSEWTKFKLSEQSGKAFHIELGVIRPYCSIRDEKGKRKYPWLNPLDRFAISNTVVQNNKSMFDNRMESVNGKDAGDNKGIVNKDGKQKTFTSAELKMGFLRPNGNYTKIEGYHVPDEADFGAAFFGYYDRIDNGEHATLYRENLVWDNPGKKEKIFSGNYYEMLNPIEDNMAYPVVSTDGTVLKNFESQKLYWDCCPIFYSVIQADKSKRRIYGIRFELAENVPKNDKKYIYETVGRRYRCAYRWILVSLGNSTQGYKNDGRGTRVIVQSRWIGNAPVSLADIMDDDWWGEADESNVFSDIDAYRVFQLMGYRDEKNKIIKQNYYQSLQYWTRTFHGWDNDSQAYDEDHNITMYRQVFSTNAYKRDKSAFKNKGIPVRMIADRDLNEFGPNSPRRHKEVSREQQWFYISTKTAQDTWTSGNVEYTGKLSDD